MGISVFQLRYALATRISARYCFESTCKTRMWLANWIS